MRNLIMGLLVSAMSVACDSSNGPVSEANAADLGQKVFIDVHHLGAGNVTDEAVAAAHKKDLATQSKYNVRFIKYWVDDKSGEVYCLSHADDKEAVIQTHKHAHGLVPDQIVEVTEGE